MNRLFAYGTLMRPEVMAAVTGRRFRAEAAYVPGYVRRPLRGRAYPGIRPWRGAGTAGLLWHGIGPAAWRRLDRYEDACYRRITVIAVTRRGRRIPAQAYVMRADAWRLLR